MLALALAHLPISFSLGATAGPRASLLARVGPSRGYSVVMQKPGSKADLTEYKDYEFSKRETTADGACFIVDDKEAPDPSKQWFYCDDPSFDDEDMVCELVPEWQGTNPSGDHAVWLCSKPKPGEPGSEADLSNYKDYEFSKRETTADGACFIVDDKEAPDPSKQWFYCDDPSFDDEDMVCELVPEWQGTNPSGDHAVWLCSKPKPE